MPYNEKAEKGDNQYQGKTGIKNNQDLETTRRSYAMRCLKILRADSAPLILLGFKKLTKILVRAMK